MSEYITVNRRFWDTRAPVHARSRDYGFDRFIDDPGFLSDVVRFDRPRLGDVSGLRGVHLQCHIGTDTLSLARLGAKMTGLDFSPAGLAQARELVDRAGGGVEFHEAEVYDAVEVLGRANFDLVYTGIGALCWLPEVARWARVVAELLRPGGRLFVREGHPMMWAFDERADAITLRYPYFEHEAPLIFDIAETYVETDAVLPLLASHSWNHSIGEIITALLDAGLRVTQFVEHDSVPWQALPGHMVADDAGEWRLAEAPERMAASYTLQAVKD